MGLYEEVLEFETAWEVPGRRAGTPNMLRYSGLRIGIILYTFVVLFFVQYNWVDFGGVRLEEGFCIVEFQLWRV